ncbi:Zinc resistance conferring protein [Tilletia horrida]|uniref:Zinc resistance conferring protein n=1 Tax=Tilletia horrida TaxID=155126 RepID=A0AAN6G978_9BASI|nr:Zinc resistance conferring protein [Tilletia horrida]
MAWGRESRLITLLVIDVIFFFVEIISGYAVGSLALVADSFHMLNDVMSLLVALYALKLSTKSNTDRDPRYSYGWQRAEILGALVNGVFLLALCFSIFMEAIERFVNINEVKNPKLVIFVGSLGLASNIVGLFLFHDHGHAHGGHSHGHSHGSHTPKPAVASTLPAPSHSSTEPLAVAGSRAAAREPELPGTPPRRRQDSNSSLPYTPAQTRAFVINAAHQMGYESGRANASSSAEGESQRLLGGSRARAQSQNEYGATSSRPPAAADLDLEAQSSAVSPGSAATAVANSHSKAHGHAAHADHSHTNGHDHDHDHDHDDHGHGAGGHSHSHSHGHGEDGSMNMRGVFLHVLGDALGNVGVILSGVFIAYTTYSWRFYTDPAISFLITIIIFHSALPLVKSASFILLQGVPPTVPIETVKASMLEVDGVLSIHELHVWQLSESKIVASVHVLVDCSPGQSERFMDIAAKLRAVLHQWGIHSTTIQPEFVDGLLEAAKISGVAVAGEPDEHGRLLTKSGTLVERELSMADNNCLLACGEDPSCLKAACCPPSKAASRRGSGSNSGEQQAGSAVQQQQQQQGSSGSNDRRAASSSRSQSPSHAHAHEHGHDHDHGHDHAH